MCMAKVMRPLIRSLGYKPAREQALLAYRFEDTSDEEEESYRRFLDRYFQPRAVAAAKRRRLQRVPLSIYEGDTR
jgi:hypothetical protein